MSEICQSLTMQTFSHAHSASMFPKVLLRSSDARTPRLHRLPRRASQTRHLLGLRRTCLSRRRMRQLWLVFLASGVLRMLAIWKQSYLPGCQCTRTLPGRGRQRKRWMWRERSGQSTALRGLRGRTRTRWGERGDRGDQERPKAS